MLYELTSSDIQNGPATPPKGSERLGVFGAWELWYNQKNNNMVFYPNDYHPGTLVLSEECLEKMLAVLKRQRPVEEIRQR